MNHTISIALVVAAASLASACQDKSQTTSPAASGSAAAATTTPPTADKPVANVSAAPAVASSAPAQPASAAASFPATAFPAKKLADYTVGLPPGGKLDKSGDDRASLETPDYKLMFKIAGAKDTIADLKGMLAKLPGYKSLTVDQPDGVVAEFEDKGAKQYVFTRYVKAGDVTVSCESALTKPAKDAAKAKEAFDVCGTIKKK